MQRSETYPYFRVLRQQFRWTNEGDAPRLMETTEARGVRSAPAELDALDRVLVNELQNDGRLIRPQSQYIGPRGLKFKPIKER